MKLLKQKTNHKKRKQNIATRLPIHQYIEVPNANETNNKTNTIVALPDKLNHHTLNSGGIE